MTPFQAQIDKLNIFGFTILFSSPEPSGSQGELIVYPWSGVRRTSSVVVVRSHFQTSSPLKPLDRSKPNCMWSLLEKGERKFM